MTLHLKVPSPDFFSGKDGEDLDNWWFQTENYLKGNDLKPDLAICHLVQLLKGDAATWVRTTHGLDSVEKFKEGLFKRFPAPSELVLRQRWGQVKMSSISELQSYISAQAAASCRITSVTDGEKLHAFLEGLEDQLKFEVTTRNPKTLVEAIEFAQVTQPVLLKRKLELNATHFQQSRKKQRVGGGPMNFKKETRTCWNCGIVGHLKRNCVKPVGSVENKNLDHSCFHISLNEHNLLKTIVIFPNFNCETQALVDSGATHNFISTEIVNKFEIPFDRITPQQLMLADGSKSFCTGSVELTFKVEEKTCDEKFMVADIKYTCILGKPWLTNNNPGIDWTNNLLSLNYVAKESPIEMASQNPILLLSSVEMENHLDESEVYLIRLNSVQEAPAKVPNDLKPILDEFKDVFPEDLPPGLPPSRFEKDFTIELKPDVKPVVRPLRRLAPVELEELQTQLADLIAKGFVRPSSSNFGASILFVKKKDGTKRMCIDYRSLNEDTIRDEYPLPLIDILFDKIRGANVFSKLDLRAGYQQVRIAEPDTYKTAFRTPMGSFEYLVLPFGLTNAPSAFMRLMDSVFPDLEYNGFLAKYMDDLLVFSKTMKEHAQHLSTVLSKLREHRLFAKLSKCVFGVNQVEFLGNVVSKKGIEVDQTKVKAILDIQAPTNLKQLRSFLGAVTYFSKFIPHYAEKSLPLFSLLRKDVPFVWGPPQMEAFQNLKLALTQAPVLRIFDPELLVTLQTDASDRAIGGVILQNDGKGDRPVAYYSKALSAAEVKYATQEKEMLALVEAFRKWRHYLLGRRFIAHTDHESLQFVKTSKDPTHRLARWFDEIAEFDFEIQYRKGKLNQLADQLSRPSPTSPAQVELLLGSTVNSSPELKMEASTLSTASTLVTDTTFLEQVKAGYPIDSYFKPVFDLLLGNQPEDKRYKLRCELFIAKDGCLFFKEGNRLCVPKMPKELRTKILSEHHETPIAGHFGSEKTYQAISTKYFWPKMFSSIESYVTTCVTCQKVKSDTPLTPGLLKPLEVPERPWSAVSLDFVSGFPVSTSGYDTILTLVDRFSKMAHFAPCSSSSISAPQTAQLFINNVFRYHGMPKTLVSDRGSQFTSEFWKSFFTLIGTKISLSTANHPQTDGQSERANRSIITLLRAFTEKMGNNWDQYLPILEFAFNNTPNSSSGFSPFQVNYGLSPLIPSDLISGNLISVNSDDINAILSRIETIHKIVKDNLMVAQDRQAAAANNDRREEIFKVGDLVLLSSKHTQPSNQVNNDKLKPKFTGPYKIVKIINQNAYELELPPSFRGHNVINVSFLKRYQKREGEEEKVAEPDDQGEYEIEKIIDMKIRYNRPEYLVHWKNTTDTENEWLTEKRLTNAQTLLENFKKTFPQIRQEAKRGRM